MRGFSWAAVLLNNQSDARLVKFLLSSICEAVTRPNRHFVPTETVVQQSCLMLHRARHLLIHQQTAGINVV